MPNKKVLPGLIQHTEKTLAKIVGAQTAIQSIKYAEKIVASHAIFEKIPGAVGKIANIILFTSGSSEGADTISIVANDAVIGIEVAGFSLFVIGEEIPGLNVVEDIILIEEIVRAHFKEALAVNKRIALGSLEFLSTLILGEAQYLTDDETAKSVWKDGVLARAKELIDNNLYDVVVMDVPDVKITKNIIVYKKAIGYSETATITACTKSVKVVKTEAAQTSSENIRVTSIPWLGSQNEIAGRKKLAALCEGNTINTCNDIYVTLVLESEKKMPIGRLFDDIDPTTRIVCADASQNVKSLGPNNVSKYDRSDGYEYNATETFTLAGDGSNSHCAGSVVVARKEQFPMIPRALYQSSDLQIPTKEGFDTTIIFPASTKAGDELNRSYHPTGSHRLVYKGDSNFLPGTGDAIPNLRSVEFLGNMNLIHMPRAPIILKQGKVLLGNTNPKTIMLKKNDEKSPLDIYCKADANGLELPIYLIEHQLVELAGVSYSESSKQLTIEFSNSQSINLKSCLVFEHPTLHFSDGFNVRIEQQSTGKANLRITMEGEDIYCFNMKSWKND